MQFEVIRKSHKKEVVIGVVAIILIAVVLLVRNSFAKYQTTKNMKIAEGTINYTVPDFKIMGIYYQKPGQTCTEDNCYEEKESMPESGYEINTTKSYCELNGSKDNNAEIYTDEKGQHVIARFTKGDKCYLLFDKIISAKDTILENITINEETPDFSKVATTDEGIFKAEDDDGDTYYFRGSVENNYVKFANKFWRIIRINGDGTIRIIYDGDTARENGTAFNVETSIFNSSTNDNMYVGFMYANGEAHGIVTKSTILETLEKWYKNNLLSYVEKIDSNAGFCGDRRPSTNPSTINNLIGNGTNETYYGSYIRLYTNKIPNLNCFEKDYYTKTTAIKGNKSLEYSIGLITADEISLAGGVWGFSNQKYYLYTGQAYWTMSPALFDKYSRASIFVESSGVIIWNNVVIEYGIRPVINLKADTKFTYKSETTKGTMNDPYVVE